VFVSVSFLRGWCVCVCVCESCIHSVGTYVCACAMYERVGMCPSHFTYFSHSHTHTHTHTQTWEKVSAMPGRDSEMSARYSIYHVK